MEDESNDGPGISDCWNVNYPDAFKDNKSTH